MTTIRAKWPTTRAVKPDSDQPTPPEPEPMPAETPEAEPIIAMGYQIAHDPIPPHRTMPSKYTELFAQWPQGAAVRCATKEARVLADALRRYLKRTGQPGKASVCSHYPGDSQTPGRVWWLAE